MNKIQYKYRRWDKEVKERKSVNALENDYKNLKTKTDLYLNPEMFKYELELSGVVITNPAIESRHSQKKDLEWISFRYRFYIHDTICKKYWT